MSSSQYLCSTPLSFLFTPNAVSVSSNLRLLTQPLPILNLAPRLGPRRAHGVQHALAIPLLSNTHQLGIINPLKRRLPVGLEQIGLVNVATPLGRRRPQARVHHVRQRTLRRRTRRRRRVARHRHDSDELINDVAEARVNGALGPLGFW